MDLDVKLTVILVGGLLIVFFAALFSDFHYATYAEHEVTITIADKNPVTAGDSHKYLIYTDANTQKEVYQDKDTLWYWKFNSCDVYSQLERGHTYKVRVAGIRWPFMSWYKNIIEIKGEVK